MNHVGWCMFYRLPMYLYEPRLARVVGSRATDRPAIVYGLPPGAELCDDYGMRQYYARHRLYGESHPVDWALLAVRKECLELSVFPDNWGTLIMGTGRLKYSLAIPAGALTMNGYIPANESM